MRGPEHVGRDQQQALTSSAAVPANQQQYLLREACARSRSKKLCAHSLVANLPRKEQRMPCTASLHVVTTGAEQQLRRDMLHPCNAARCVLLGARSASSRIWSVPLYNADEPHGAHVSVLDRAVYGRRAVRRLIGIFASKAELSGLYEASPGVVVFDSAVYRDSGRKDRVRGHHALAASPGLLRRSVPEDQCELRERDHAVKFLAAVTTATAA